MPPLTTHDEGYIKFKANWQSTPPFSINKLAELDAYRQKLYQLKLIGAYPDGIGYGNISQRIPTSNQFFVSGSATGSYTQLTNQHYAKVRAFNLRKNTLDCQGPIIASSESMSHAVIYQECNWVNGVIHVHHLQSWEKLLHVVPTTDQSATYGTPEMAASIIHLLKTTDLEKQKIFVMEGHREGIFAFGKGLQEAFGVIKKWIP